MSVSTPIRRVAIIPDLARPYDRQVLEGVGRYVRDRGRWNLYIHEDPQLKLTQLDRWQGDGVIANLDDPQVFEAVSSLGTPVVGFGGARRRGDRIVYMATDDHAIAALAAEHLLERGFRHFAYCGLPADRGRPWVDARGRAFRGLIRQAGGRVHGYRGDRGSMRRWQRLMDHMSRWIVSLPRPVGLLACNDARARQVLEVCRHLGVRVPEEVAVIGVDNDQLICELSIPPLSSVIQGTERLGYQAAALLDEVMAGHRVEREALIVPPVGVATRQSTEILAIDDPLVTRAMRFVTERATSGIQVGDVLAAVGVSRATLDQRFKARLGRTVHAEIQRVRLREMQGYLRTTDMTLDEIARRCGFRYVQYMAATFRRLTGMSPGEYRRRVRGRSEVT